MFKNSENKALEKLNYWESKLCYFYSSIISHQGEQTGPSVQLLNKIMKNICLWLSASGTPAHFPLLCDFVSVVHNNLDNN